MQTLNEKPLNFFLSCDRPIKGFQFAKLILHNQPLNYWIHNLILLQQCLFRYIPLCFKEF